MLPRWRRTAMRHNTVGGIGFDGARALQTEVDSEQKKRGRKQR